MRKRFKQVIALVLALCIGFVTTNLQVVAKEELGNEGTIVETVVSENTIGKEQEEKKWDGITTTNVFEGKNYKVIFTLVEFWQGGYNASVKIENTGDEVIENWALEFDHLGTISNIWNGTISKQEGLRYVIKNALWNQDIAVGGSVEFGMSGNEDFVGFPENYELQGELNDVVAGAYAMNYQLENDWGSGFTSQISIINQSEVSLEDWVVEFDYARTITTIWNATILSHEGNHYVIKNAGHNSNILPTKSVVFGFNGKDGKSTDEPMNYKLYSYSENSEISENELVISVNEKGQVYNETGDFYVVKEQMKTLTGTLSDSEKIKKLDYEIEDIK